MPQEYLPTFLLTPQTPLRTKKGFLLCKKRQFKGWVGARVSRRVNQSTKKDGKGTKRGPQRPIFTNFTIAERRGSKHVDSGGEGRAWLRAEGGG